MTTQFMDDTWHFIYNEIFYNYMPDIFKQYEYTPWIFSLLGSALIGLSGILPLFLIPVVDTTNNRSKNDGKGGTATAGSDVSGQIINDRKCIIFFIYYLLEKFYYIFLVIRL